MVLQQPWDLPTRKKHTGLHVLFHRVAGQVGAGDEAHVTVRHGDLGVSPPIRERGRAFAPSVEVRQGASVRILPITSNEMLPPSAALKAEALRHAGIHNHARVHIEYIDSEFITPDNVNQLAKFDAVLVPGGFGIRGVEGKIASAQFARENKVPYLGICLGMQVATIEYARHMAGLKDANSTEFVPDGPNPVIALINEWKDADGSIQTRTANSNLGGTMRLGAQSSDVAPGTLAHKIYGDVVTERHRHRYEANVNYLDTLRKAGLVISALTQREQLTEIVELPQTVHPWYMGVQFHPEFKSTPWDGHPLFNAFVKAALDHKAKA